MSLQFIDVHKRAAEQSRCNYLFKGSLEKSEVEISDLDAELFSELSSSSLIRVDASIRRPPPAELTQAPLLFKAKF